MDYKKFPPRTVLTPDQFVCELNKAIKTLPFFQEGMIIMHDANGYWLEFDEEVNIENNDLLSAARKLVLNRQ